MRSPSRIPLVQVMSDLKVVKCTTLYVYPHEQLDGENLYGCACNLRRSVMVEERERREELEEEDGSLKKQNETCPLNESGRPLLSGL